MERDEDADMSSSKTTDELIDKLVDLQRIADYLGISQRHAYNLVARGILPPPIKLGRSSRWRLADIRTFVEKL